MKNINIKKIVFLILWTVFCAIMAYAQEAPRQDNPPAVTYQKVDGDTYKAQPKKRAKTAKKSTYIPTGKYYIHTDNKKYEIHSHEVTRGKDAGKTCYYIYIVPKSGDGYWKKLNNFSL